MTDPHAPQAEEFRLGLDGHGGLCADVDGAPVRWTHYRLEEEAAEWLAARRRLPEEIAEALVVENARPRATVLDEGVLVVLRGVNLDPGAEPEDMVSVRIWLDEDRIITICPRRVRAVADVKAMVEGGKGPRSPGGILAAIIDRLMDRMRPVIDGLEEQVDDLHDRLLQGENGTLHRPLADLRHACALFRRHMAPQRDALLELHRSSKGRIPAKARDVVHHAADRQIRYVEDVDSVRERATVLQDEIDHEVAKRLNHNIYVLSVVAAVFLPLGLLTGLLGINVGGIPGTDSPFAFWIVCGLLGVIALFEVWFLRRSRML